MSLHKPSEKEEEFFARREFERRQREAREKQTEEAAEEANRLKALHHMHCPKCGRDLVEVQFQEIKIDKCTGCEGVWLDPGELDELSGEMILERERYR